MRWSAVAGVVIMGVAGVGKTTIGTRVADALGRPFLDADDAHPAANVAKMAAGEPLTDDDRAPWLARLRDELRATPELVITCSALKLRYRDVLRTAGPIQFVYLELNRAAVIQRLEQRQEHFMGAAMADSQFAALEPPAAAETDVVTIDVGRPPDAVVAEVLAAIDAPNR